MKRSAYFFLSIILVGATFILSCSKSSSTSGNVPTIHFVVGSGYISSDTSVRITSPLLFGITATTDNGSLNRFFVQRTTSGKTRTEKDSSFNASSFNYNLHSVAREIIISETWVFTIFDNNGRSSAVTLKITTTGKKSNEPIYTYSIKVFSTQTKKIVSRNTKINT